MKRKLFNIYLITLVFVGIIICINLDKTISIKGDTITGDYHSSDEEIIYKESYLSYYFSKLKSNKGYNSNGTCGFVALSMELSYYDTYFDDSIISDNFDENSYITDSQLSLPNILESPGIKNERDIYGSSTLDNGQLMDLIVYGTDNEGVNYYDIYFQYSLIRKARIMGIDRSLGLENIDLWNLICYYLNNEIDSLSAINIDSLFEYNIKRYIDMGYPVIVCLNNGNLINYEGHFVVAYDYDDDTGTIYANYGYLDGQYHCALNADEYVNIDGAFVIYPKNGFTHNHSNNYIRSYDSKLFCSCQFSEHESHIHQYVTLSTDESTHTYFCICGNMTNEQHVFSFKFKNNKYHTSSCDCGLALSQLHRFRLKYTSGVQYRYCLDCGYQYVYRGMDVYNKIQALVG